MSVLRCAITFSKVGGSTFEHLGVVLFGKVSWFLGHYGHPRLAFKIGEATATEFSGYYLLSSSNDYC